MFFVDVSDDDGNDDDDDGEDDDHRSYQLGGPSEGKEVLP